MVFAKVVFRPFSRVLSFYRDGRVDTKGLIVVPWGLEEGTVEVAHFHFGKLSPIILNKIEIYSLRPFAEVEDQDVAPTSPAISRPEAGTAVI